MTLDKFAHTKAQIATSTSTPSSKLPLSYFLCGSTTGNLGDTNVNEMRRLLKQRYATPRNDERFDGALNTAHLIDYVLLPELAIVLVMHACGGDITEEHAVEFLERPVISEAERRRVLAEARGDSIVHLSFLTIVSD